MSASRVAFFGKSFSWLNWRRNTKYKPFNRSSRKTKTHHSTPFERRLCLLQQVNGQLFRQQRLARILIRLLLLLATPVADQRLHVCLHVPLKVLEAFRAFLLVILRLVKLFLHRAALALQHLGLCVDVGDQVRRKDVLTQFGEQIKLVSGEIEFGQVLGQFHSACVQVKERLQVLVLILAVLQPGLRVLVQLQLVDVEQELGHDLLGVGKHHLNDAVMVLAHRHNAREYVLARVGGLK